MCNDALSGICCKNINTYDKYNADKVTALEISYFSYFSSKKKKEKSKPYFGPVYAMQSFAYLLNCDML